MDFYRSKKKSKKSEAGDAGSSSEVKEQVQTIKGAILQLLHGVDGGLTTKKLRRSVLALMGTEANEENQEEFDKTVEKLVEKGKLNENDGVYTKPEKVKKEKPEKADKEDKAEKVVKDKKRKASAVKEEKEEEGDGEEPEDPDDNAPMKKKRAKDAINNAAGYSAASAAANIDLSKNGEQAWRDGLLSQEYLSSNPDNITRLFVGNLNRKITEEELRGCFEGVTHIKWITDKQTREFYGSTFLEFKDVKCAAMAVQKDKSKYMGRPLKIYYCPPRPGDIWPPRFNGREGEGEGFSGGGGEGFGSNSSAKPRAEKTVKPVGCKKLFAGDPPSSHSCIYTLWTWDTRIC